MARIWIGIDPGLTGGVAFIPQEGEAWVDDIPVSQYSATGFVKRAFNPGTFAHMLESVTDGMEFQPVSAHAFLERVSAFPGQGVASMFSLGMSYWGAYSVCRALKIPVSLIEPKEWKRFFRLEKDKSLARGMAQRFFPHIELARVKDHNRAEALLIAQYGRHITEGK